MKTGCFQTAAVACLLLLPGVSLKAQSPLRKSDPKIRTELTVASVSGTPGQPIVIDVYVENLDRADIRKDRFSPLSSSVGLPSIRIVAVSGGEEVTIAPGLFVEDFNEWDRWYLPGTPPGERLVMPARTRVHLLHGDLRLAIQGAGAYCQAELDRHNLLEQPDERATKQHYQDVVRFARRFSAGGAFDVTVWAYAQSNTVRFRSERLP